MTKRTLACLATLAVGVVALGVAAVEARAVADDSAPGVAVHVGKIERATVHRWVVAYGHVDPEPAGAGKPGASAQLSAPTTGVVADVLCSEGQRVEKGQLLIRLASPAADAAIRFATRSVERERRLLPTGGTSEKALQDAERGLAEARAQRALFRVEAPFAGVITRVAARPGETVDPSRVLGEIEDPDRLVVTLGVPGPELAGLTAGETVIITAAGHEEVATASLTYVSPRIDPQTGLAMVRAALPSGSGLRSGQFVRARIAAEERRDRLTVPAVSLVEDENGRSAISIVEGDLARRHAVVRGLRDGDVVEISGEGLAEGMRVVTEGAYGLPDEARIRVLP